MGHLTEQEIAQCADALTSGKYDELPGQIKEHLASCDVCAHEVLMVTDFSEKIKLVSPKRKNKKFWLITSSVAAVIAVLVIGNTILNKAQRTEQQATVQVLPAQRENTDVSTEKTTLAEHLKSAGKNEAPAPQKTTKMQKEELLAYSPNDNLEKLAQNFKGKYRGEDISVITSHEFNCSGTDSLRWSNPENIGLTVEIYNNKGIKTNTITSSGNKLALPGLSPGLFYWKLINNDFDLLFCGKLIIR